jgi:hypothetical protein
MKVIKGLFIVCLMFLTCRVANASNEEKLENIPFLGLEGQAKVAIDSVCAILIEGNTKNIDKNDDWKPIGTGFFCSYSDHLFVATCFHVVSQLRKQNKPVVVGIATDQGFRISKCKAANLDQENDIAILIPQKKSQDTAVFSQLKNNIDDFGSINDLVIGRGIVTPGFPLLLGYQEDTTSPTVRIGIIAQYIGNGHFLVDGVASHGQSGSPVYTVSFKKRKLVGMITSHMTDRINLLDENGRVAASLPYNSGLARAVIIDLVKEAILNSKY